MTDDDLRNWRQKFERRMMVSGIEEYCPDEFGVLLDEAERFRRLLTAMKIRREQMATTRSAGLKVAALVEVELLDQLLAYASGGSL